MIVVARVLIGELLINARVITREQLDEALALPRPKGRKIGQLLIERGWLTEAQLTQTLSLQLGIPWVSLYHIDFAPALLGKVPREVAERHCLIPIFVRHVKGHGETLYVAIEDPKNDIALGEVSRAAGLPTRPMIASPTDIKSAIRLSYGGEDAVPTVNIIEGKAEPPVVPATIRDGRRPVGPTPAPATTPTGAPAITPTPSAPPVAMQPPAAGGPAVSSAAVPPAASSPSGPPTPRSSSVPPPGKRGKMVELTLLDGTTLALPARGKKSSEHPGANVEALTARDLVSALRAVTHGADASEILGDSPQWEPILAALLSVMLRKGLIADWEFIDEYRKI